MEEKEFTALMVKAYREHRIPQWYVFKPYFEWVENNRQGRLRPCHIHEMRSIALSLLKRYDAKHPDAFEQMGAIGRDDPFFPYNTNGIVKDLENDYDFLYQQDCDITIDGFKQSMKEVQERVESLKDRFEKAKEMTAEGDADMEIAPIQSAFCERMVEFINSLIEKVQGWRDSALTSKEANDCFFVDVRFDEEELPRIYHNLVNRGWISGNRTSLDNFIYLFTGKGFRPTQPVLWKKGEDELSLFIEEMTIDGKDLSKAALIFEKRRKGGYGLVDKRQLSAARSRINNQRLMEKHEKLRIMYREIFEFPDWEELAKNRAYDSKVFQSKRL